MVIFLHGCLHEKWPLHTTDLQTGFHSIDLTADWRLVWNASYLQQEHLSDLPSHQAIQNE